MSEKKCSECVHSFESCEGYGNTVCMYPFYYKLKPSVKVLNVEKLDIDSILKNAGCCKECINKVRVFRKESIYISR